ncbi:hypothetical protein D920_01116 [Enterococcus faecalis 13-SD-W-01]|nr:hypothetical protein D920_01116 [Enterococcus faecalis 13-SD-W-01]
MVTLVFVIPFFICRKLILSFRCQIAFRKISIEFSYFLIGY